MAAVWIFTPMLKMRYEWVYPLMVVGTRAVHLSASWLDTELRLHRDVTDSRCSPGRRIFSREAALSQGQVIDSTPLRPL